MNRHMSSKAFCRTRWKNTKTCQETYSQGQSNAHICCKHLTEPIKITGYLSFYDRTYLMVFCFFNISFWYTGISKYLTGCWHLKIKDAIIQEFDNSDLLSNQRKLLQAAGVKNAKYYWSFVLGVYVLWKRKLLNLTIYQK